MKVRIYLLFVLTIAAITLFQLDEAIAKSRHWTITDRQVALSSKVTAGEKSNELTKKEADKFRSRLQDVDERINKAKAKNGGKLSYKDQGKIESALNDISIDLQKKQLAKRVQPK
jgi:hypothetical protein